MAQKYYAHSLEGKPPSEWQPLEVHLKIVAEMVDEFARPFKDEAWARLAGLWHDIGKYSKDSQFVKKIGGKISRDRIVFVIPERAIMQIKRSCHPQLPLFSLISIIF